MTPCFFIRTPHFYSLFLAVLLVQGCSSLDTHNDARYPTNTKIISNKLSDEERAEIRQTRVDITGSGFNIRFKGVDMGGKERGGLEGAAEGAVMGVVCGVEYPPAMIITVPVGIVVGGILGSAISESKDDVKALTDASRRTIKYSNLQGYLAQQIRLLTSLPPQESSNYIPSLAAEKHNTDAIETYDSVLDIIITEVGTRSANYNPSLFSHAVLDVVVKAHVRLVRTRDGIIVFEGDSSYRSKASHAREIEEWTNKNSALLCAEIRHGLTEIARTIIRDIFPHIKQPANATALEKPGLAHLINTDLNTCSHTHISLENLTSRCISPCRG